MSGKLAVLVPAFNGSHFLLQSVESCACSGLDASRYGIIVVDNCSTDGSAVDLPSFDANGAPIRIVRNERNLGRIGNWNRALQVAEKEGFRYATFLFMGDEWLPDGSIGSLLDAMEASESVLGMAPLRIVREDGKPVRDGARISIEGPVSYTDTKTLLKNSIGTGRLPFAPIQANVYRLFSDQPLVFETGAERELNADVEGTAAFLESHPGVVTIVAEPYLIWRERQGRFFSAQDPWSVFTETRRSLRRLSNSTGIPVDWESANAVAMLAALREPSQSIPLRTRLLFAARVFRFLWQDDAGLSLRRMWSYVLRKLFSGQSYLVVPAAPSSSGLGTTAVSVLPDQCRP